MMPVIIGDGLHRNLPLESITFDNTYKKLTFWPLVLGTLELIVGACWKQVIRSVMLLVISRDGVQRNLPVESISLDKNGEKLTFWPLSSFFGLLSGMLALC